MTVSSQINKSGPYLENGVTTEFEYEFKIADASHIKVVRATDGVETVLELTADYTVTGVGNAAGGNVVIGTPVSGSTLTLILDVPFTQELDLENQGAYNAEDVEKALDLGVQRDKQLAEQISRAVLVPVSADASDYTAIVDDVLRLGDSIEQIDAVAAKITEVIVAADNMDAILAAPGAAASAAADRVQTGLDRSATEAAAAGAGVTDGNKGEVSVTGSGSSWAINSGAVTDGKLASSLSQRLGYVAYFRSEIKALDTTRYQRAYLTGDGYEGDWVWRTGDYTALIAADPYGGLFLKSDNHAETAGAWVRVVQDGVYNIDWWGAHEYPDMLAIFDSAKHLVAGAVLDFGPRTYGASDALFYEGADNKPLLFRGVPGLTRIENSGTGFTIKYYGMAGGGNEARGGGVVGITCAKSGTGKCNGIEVANVYRARIENNDTSECGGIGISVAGRGVGDYDATFGLTISKNKCRDGEIGIRILPEESGSLQAAQIDIIDNNLDYNAVTGLWLSNFDQVLVRNNTISGCGHGGSGLLNRGNIYVGYNGIIPRNLRIEQNEIGNNLPNGDQHIIVECIRSLRSLMNRFVRNSGEAGTVNYLFGFSASSVTMEGIVLTEDYPIATDNTPALLYAGFGGTDVTFLNPVEIHNMSMSSFSEDHHTIANASDADKAIVFKNGRDRRVGSARIDTVGGGGGSVLNISTNVSLHHRVRVTVDGGTSVAVTGAKRDGDMLTLELYNNSGGSTTIVLSSGLQGVSPPVGDGLIHRAMFRYRTAGGVWEQVTGWAAV